MAFCHPHKHQESNTVYTIRNEKNSVEAPLYISFFCVWHCTSKRCCSCSITKSPLLLSFSDCRYKAEIVVATLCKNKNLKPPLHITVQRYLNVVAIDNPESIYSRLCWPFAITGGTDSVFARTCLPRLWFSKLYMYQNIQISNKNLGHIVSCVGELYVLLDVFSFLC